MAGADAETDSRRRDKRTVAAVLGVLALVLLSPVLAHIPSYLRYQRQRAAARHVEALGGKCKWKRDSLRWPFAQLASLLGKRYAKLHSERLCYINLNGPKVADADLVHLKGLTGLQALHLQYTQVTDAGLVHLKGLTGLELLRLYGSTQITDAGLVHLKGLTGLTHLSLSFTQVTDAGLVHLKDLTGLKYLDLNNTQVTDAGVADLKREDLSPPCQGLVDQEVGKPVYRSSEAGTEPPVTPSRRCTRQLHIRIRAAGPVRPAFTRAGRPPGAREPPCAFPRGGSGPGRRPRSSRARRRAWPDS